VITIDDQPTEITVLKPVTPREPVFLILFASGDAGFRGVCGEIFEHLAEHGAYVAAFDSRLFVKRAKRSGAPVEIPAAAAGVDSALVQARHVMGLAETTPVIVSGFSRGANLVVFTAGVKSLQHHLGGALAVALTREADFLEAPDASVRPPAVKVDDKGRIQTYPAIELAGALPFAVIQSKGDSYVPAEEARRLFGPDTPTRRLYEVDARNHGFSGGRDALMRDLDDALAWIEAAVQVK
jgi:type IV secretory pathway VirJ component